MMTKNFSSHLMRAVCRRVVLFVSILAGLFAQEVSATCGITAGAEWIYFSPVSESIRFAELLTFASVNVVNNDRIQNRLDHYYSGYRVFASYEFCRLFLYGRYTHLKARHQASATAHPPTSIISNAYSTDAGNFATFISDNKTFQYEAGDVLVGCRLAGNCLFSFEAFAGVHYAYLHNLERFFIAVDVAPLTVPFNAIGSRKTNLNGAGPEVGASIFGHIGWGFSLHAAAIGGFVTGKSTLVDVGDLFSPATGALLSTGVVAARGKWRTIPYNDVRIGLRYRFCLPLLMGIGGSVEGGYEGLVYYEALINTGAPGVVDSRTFRDIVMHGPYISAALFF